MAGVMPDVVYNTMIDGLAALTLLRLPRTPPADGLATVAQVWEAALCHACEWYDADALRLSASFAAVAATAQQWPAPRDIIANLPKRPPPPALPAPQTVPCPPHIAAEIATLMGTMIINQPTED